MVKLLNYIIYCNQLKIYWMKRIIKLIVFRVPAKQDRFVTMFININHFLEHCNEALIELQNLGPSYFNIHLLWFDLRSASSIDNSAQFILPMGKNQMHGLIFQFLRPLQVSLAPVGQDRQSALFGLQQGSLCGYRYWRTFSVNMCSFFQSCVGTSGCTLL